MITLSELKKIIADYSINGDIKSDLNFAHQLFKVYDDFPEVSSLSGKCVHYSSGLQRYAKNFHNFNDFIYTKGGIQEIHTFLKCKTSDEGIQIIDPTLGGLIIYPQIFVGTRQKLEETFMDERNHLILNGPLWGLNNKSPTRREYFDALYTEYY